MHILTGISGGIDSAMTAYLLQQAGYNVIGATMQIINNSIKAQFMDAKIKGCFSLHEEMDIKDCQHIADVLKIPYYLVDCKEAFTQLVLNNFKNEYKLGRTPNPCIRCNTKIKFDVLPNTARQQGIIFDKFATGHYAKIEYNADINRYQLKCAKDSAKDQTYFLYRLSQAQLSTTLMPLGDYLKTDIRKMAEDAGIIIAHKSESQDFYTGDLNDILQYPDKKGNFVDLNGKILGHHMGSYRYTIGQRKGLGISSKEPLYVIEINAEKNQVVLASREHCMQNALLATDICWCSIAPRQSPFDCMAKIRSSQKAVPVHVVPQSVNSFIVYFKSSPNAIAPGQSVVLYDNATVLGGGIIKKGFVV